MTTDLTLSVIQPVDFGKMAVFTRASVGYYDDADGVLKSALSDTPRVNYDSTNLLLAPSLLQESAGTNLFTYSEQLDHANWTKTSLPITANARVAPDGTTTMDLAIPAAAASVHSFAQSPTLAANSSYVASVYAAANGYSWVIVEFYTGTASTFASIDVLNGVAGTVDSALTVVIGSLRKDGTRRIAVSGVTAASGTPTIKFYVSSANNTTSFTGNGFSGIYFWGMNVLLGTSLTSYIQTVAAAVTRAADVLTGGTGLGFKRNSTARFVGSNGLLQSAAVDVPRMTYDPLNLGALPLPLTEPLAATNLITQPSDFANAYWTKVAGVTVTANTDSAPDGTVTMDTLTGVAATITYIKSSSIAVLAATAYSISNYIKAGNSARSYLRLFDGSAATEIASVTILWTAGVPSVFSTSGTWSVAPTFENFGGGLYRLKGAASSGSFTTMAVLYHPDALNGALTSKAWGFMLEQGSAVTSYTTGTRAADLFTGQGMMYSNIPEPATGDIPDPAYYNSGTTYAINTQVLYPGDHMIYQSVQGSNTGNDPSLDLTSVWWSPVVVSNRYRMVDQRNASQSSMLGGINVVLRPNTICTGLSILNIDNIGNIRVIMDDDLAGLVFDEVYSLQAPPSRADYWEYCFEEITLLDYLTITNLPSYKNARLRIIGVSSATVAAAIGVVVAGKVRILGAGVEYGARIGIQDYGIKKANGFGDYEVQDKGYAKRANFDTWIDNDSLDYVQKLLASLRITPCVWIGTNLYSSTQIYGFYKDFDTVLRDFSQSLLSIQIEGLT